MKLVNSVFLICIISAAAYGQATGPRTPAAIPDGYGSIKWGTPLSKAREAISGKLYYTDDKTVIVSKDDALEYYYGFFYTDPANTEKAVETADAGQEAVDEGTLYYVALKFPYLRLNQVREKIESKYGKSSLENIKKNRGAAAWMSDSTIIIMWADEYEGEPFCRRITYLSRETAKKVNTNQERVFNKTEIDILKKLNP